MHAAVLRYRFLRYYLHLSVRIICVYIYMSPSNAMTFGPTITPHTSRVRTPSIVRNSGTGTPLLSCTLALPGAVLGFPNASPQKGTLKKRHPHDLVLKMMEPLFVGI